MPALRNMLLGILVVYINAALPFVLYQLNGNASFPIIPFLNVRANLFISSGSLEVNVSGILNPTFLAISS